MIKNKHKNLYKQCLHVKKLFKKFLYSIKLFLLFSTEIFSTEYRDVQYRVPRCRICSVPRCPDTDPEIEAYIVTSPENTYHRGKHGDNKVHRSSACGYNCSK